MTSRGTWLAVALALTLWTAASVARAQETAPRQGADARTLLGAPRGAPRAGDALARYTHEVAQLLRCPVCQGLSVADSPATMAVNMRTQVRELAQQGYDQEQILTYFERSYGEFVRLRPPLRGVNWLVWMAPVAGLGLGAAMVWRFLRRRAPRAPATTPREGGCDEDEGDDALPADAELAAYVPKVRDRAYGPRPRTGEQA